MIILLLILALIVLWAIVLGPALLEKRKGSPANSIVAFNNRLSVLASTQTPAGLQQTGRPVLQAGASRRTPVSELSQSGSFPSPGSTVTLVTGDGRPVSQPGPRRFPAPQQQQPMPLATRVKPSPKAGSHVTAQQIRRKQILQVLVGAAGITFLLGLLPGARLILLVSFVFIALLGGYVYMLLQWKQNLIEQEHKVRHLRVTEMQGPAGVILDESDDGLRLVSGESKQ